MPVGKKTLFTAIFALLCSMVFCDEAALLKEAKNIIEASRNYREGSEEYKAACIKAGEKYLEAAEKTKSTSWKSQHFCDACALFIKAGDKERTEKTAAAGAAFSGNMRVLHYFHLARAGRMNELYESAKEAYRLSPSGAYSSYCLGAMFIAAADNPARLAEAVEFAESERHSPLEIFSFGRSLLFRIFSDEHKKEWQKRLLPAISRAPFVKYAAEAKKECLRLEIQDMDVESGERFLAKNPDYRRPLLEEMVNKYIACNRYQDAEKAYREIADSYQKEIQAWKLKYPKQDPIEYAAYEFLAREQVLLMMIRDGRKNAAIKEAEALLPAYKDDLRKSRLAEHIKNWAYEEKLYELSLKYAEIYKKYALRRMKSIQRQMSDTQFKREKEEIEKNALSTIYKAYAALNRQNEMFRALDEFARYLGKDDSTADYEKGMFLIRNNKLSEAQKYLDRLEALSKKSSVAYARYERMKRALEKAGK